MIKCNWIPVNKGADKICHFGVGMIIAIIAVLISEPMWGFVVAALGGIAKELWDYGTYGKFDFFDMFATVSGGVVGIMAVGLIETIG